MRRNCTMRLLVVLSMLVSGYGIAEAAYTYKLLNADGEVVAVTENTTNKYELPWYMESPYVTAYHFYDDEARTGTAHAKGDALSLADGSTIYVTYDVDTSRAPFDKANGTYSITINGKKIYAQTSGIYQSPNNSYAYADLWTVSGDPYLLKIHPKAKSAQWIQTANANDGTEFMPGTSSTVMLIKGQNNNNADNIIMCANNGQTVISDTRPQANWYQGKSQLKIWVTTKGDDKIAFTEEINPDDLFTVILVDKQGNEVFNVKADASTGDPLPRQYRSPFAENYKYYETKAEAQANTITFKLYDKDGNYMADASNVPDYSVVGASVGDAYESLFANSTQMRRYCDYTFYSDEAFTTEVTAVEEDGDRTIYVKWDYSDDAPVFSQGSDPKNYQYYIVGSTPTNRLLVTGNATDGFALNNQSNQVGAVADHQHQFALVGNPYSTRLYSRQAGQCLGYDGSKIVFADATTASTELELLVSDNPNYKQFMPAVRGTGKNIYNNTGNFELREIIVPVSVFKEGATAQADIKDMQEYAFTLDGRATNDRIATDMLNTTDNSIGTTHDYQHAFCDYTFYGEYNGSALSSPVPDDGLPIFGGKEQKHCAFFATNTVDEEQFDRLYLIANVAENQFTGKGAATSSPAGYGLTIAGSLDAARADTENTFRWLMTGDPYNLQLTCPGPSFIGLLHLIRGKAASFVKSNSAILFCCKCFDGKKLTAC